MSDNAKPQPTFYVTHGAGPCFFMEWNPPDAWNSMAAWFSGVASSLTAKPSAILVVSAHWEEDEFTVSSSPHPKMIYDYGGFPEATYRLRYDAPGSPELAARAAGLLGNAGQICRVDPDRGFDHGVFVPLLLMFPDARIPVVSMSVRSNLDPGDHLAAGGALESLRREGVLIVGSGSSFHGGFGPSARTSSQEFDDWLSRAVADPAARAARLSAWKTAPSASVSHPREEHLVPLMVAAGAAPGEAGVRVFSDVILSTRMSAFRFG